MKSYFKLTHPTMDRATGRFMTEREEHVFFDDDDYPSTRHAYNAVCARVKRDARVSVYRTPSVAGPWARVPAIMGELPCAS